MVKSHEYLSKTILKNFSTKENGKFYTNYIHFPSKHIHYANIEVLNTRSGAYTNENEANLENDFETHLGDIQDAFWRSCKNKAPFYYS